jgi:DNA-binding NarL/FixJ family response regulator
MTTRTEAQAHAPGGLRVAIIDSNPDVRRALERRLAEDPRVACASAFDFGPLVREAVAAFAPHAILIDPRLPEDDPDKVTTPTVCAERRPERGYVVVVHVSYYRPAEELSMKAAGADVYCLKGMPTSTLVGLLVDTVRRRLPVERWPAAAREAEMCSPIRGI